MRWFLLLSFLVSFGHWAQCRVSEEVKVTLNHGGVLVGKYMTSHRGHGFCAFLGVPYAEPPVGPLRFQAPFPKLPWIGEVDATDGTKYCPQFFKGAIAGSEDCLYANVYVPLRPKAQGPLPVMVYIHGGGFVTGSGGIDFWPPGYFMDHDVILVTFNYRLGTLGFLSLATPELLGNMGLKDQHLLLQWVQDNIESFGGDPRQVTLFGESAGGASVGFHLVSKISVGLFQRAILQSGTQYAPWAYDQSGRNPVKTQQLAEGLGCANEDTVLLLDCIRTKTVEEIIYTGMKVFNPMDAPFLPNAEASLEGMVQKAPWEYKRSIGLDIPIMIGVTSEEGALFSALFMGTDSDESWQMQKDHLDIYVDQMSRSGAADEETRRQNQQQAKDFYFKDGDFSRGNLRNVTNFYSDGYFLAPFDEFLENRLVTNEKSADTYVYLFTHRGEISFPDLLPAFGFPVPQIEADLGVCHVDDLIYLFDLAKTMAPQLVPSEVDELVQVAMTEMWVSFATKGRPSTSVKEGVAWPAARGFPLDYLRIGNYEQPQKSLLGVEKGLLKERLGLWRELKSIGAQGNKNHHNEL